MRRDNMEIPLNHLAKTLCQRLNIRLPIIQAPMAGGVVNPTLIAEVVKSGGLGSLPLGYLNLQEAQQVIRQTREKTKGSFSINIFIPSNEIETNSVKIGRMLHHINYYRGQLGLPAKSDVAPLIEANSDELIDMAISEGVSILSFTFGLLSKNKINELHKKGLFVMGTATTVREGLALESVGCDAVIAQGYEAGGHRGGGYLNDHPGGLIGNMALIPQMVDALAVPVIAAGGIMDGRGVIASLSLGASAVQLGTAFLTCHESAASATHKRMILESTEESTCITSVFTGKPVRGLKNSFVAETEKEFSTDELLAYPTQHQLTKEFRSKASQLGQSNYTSFWSGQGGRLSRDTTVSDFMSNLEKEMTSVVSTLKGSPN